MRKRGVEGTTHREVVDKARTRQELIERLYAFTMNTRLGVGPRGSRQALGEATADMIVRLLELSQLEVSSETALFEHTIAALQRVCAPEPGARLHQAVGWRARVKQLLLAELGMQRDAPRDVERVDPRLVVAPGEPSPGGVCLGDLPERVLGEIHAQLERSWAKVLEEVRTGMRAASRTTTWPRRAAIVRVLADLAAAETEHGVVSDNLEAVLDRVTPEQVIGRVKEEVRLGRVKGSVQVSDSVWRKDVATVRSFFRERLAWMRETECELRLTRLARWTGRVVQRDLQAKADRLRGDRGEA